MNLSQLMHAKNRNYVYILECYKKGVFRCFYTGETHNINKRLMQHIENVKNKDTKKYTGRFDFVKLVWKRKCLTIADAKRLERAIKLLDHSTKRKLINNQIQLCYYCHMPIKRGYYCSPKCGIKHIIRFEKETHLLSYMLREMFR